MSISASERIALVRKAEEGWLDYQRRLAELTDSDLEQAETVGFWAGRDLIIHIACWERHCAWLLEQWEAGRERQYSYDFDQGDMEKWDEWNEAQVAPYRDMPIDSVRQFALETHFQAMAVVASSPEIDESFVSGMTWAHYEWHQGDIQNIKEGN